MTGVQRSYRVLPLFALVALLAVGLRARVASAEPNTADGSFVVRLIVLQDTQTRVAADAKAAVKTRVTAGQFVYLLEGRRDATGTAWYHVQSAFGSDLGWLPRSTVVTDSVQIEDFGP